MNADLGMNSEADIPKPADELSKIKQVIVNASGVPTGRAGGSLVKQALKHLPTIERPYGTKKPVP